MPPNPSDVFSANEQITTEKSTWESPEDEDGYGSEDDLSELEGEELEESLREWKGTKEAQIQVKKFGSRKQTSHRRVYETVAQAFD